MAERTAEQVLVEAFDRAHGASLADALQIAGRQIEGLRTVNEALAEALGRNTVAVIESGSSRGAAGVVADAGKTAASVLTSGLGLAPLFTSLFRLFRGGQKEELEPLIEYAAPAVLRVNAANSSLSNGTGGLPSVDYSQDGLPRVVERTSFAPQITVQVSAMDSRSFLDHSDDIARAVREAMLNMHSLNDVVSDL